MTRVVLAVIAALLFFVGAPLLVAKKLGWLP